MHKLVFSLLFSLLLVACKNTPNPTPDTSTSSPAAPTEVPVSPEAMQEAAVNLTTGVKMMEDLRKQLDALPNKIKKEKSADLKEFYNSTEGLIEKQSLMLDQLNAVLNPDAKASEDSAGGAIAPISDQVSNTPISSDIVKSYNDAAARYAKEAQRIQEAITQWTAPAK